MKEFIRDLALAIYLALGGEKPYKPTVDIPSPRDIIPDGDIIFRKSTGTVEIKNVDLIWLTDVQDTNSLDPVIDKGHTAILTERFIVDDLRVGDVCVYEIPQKIIHRIKSINHDEQGRYFTFKGDNNHYDDPYRVRDFHITHLLLGIIY